MRHTLARTLAACVVTTLVGCASVSLSQIKQFGAATKALGEHARSAMELAAAASVERQIYDVASDPNNPDKVPTDATFQGLFTGGSSPDARSEKLALRLRALEQLSDYASALQLLAEADFDEEIDTASRGLNGSLVGLRATFKEAVNEDLPIDEKALGIVATVVNAIGKAVAREKQRDALTTVIKLADPSVQKVAKLIAEDMGKDNDGNDSELAKLVEAAISNSRGSVQLAYNLERGRSTFEARLALLMRAKQLYEAETNTPRFFAAVSEGAVAVGEAHGALLKAAQAGDFSSAEVARLLGSLEGYVKSVREFYKSVQPQGQ